MIELKTFRIIGLMILLSVAGASCMSGVGPPIGILYTGTKFGTTANGGPASKTGRACATGYLGLVAIGDASVVAAAKSAGITNTKTVDHEVTAILYGLYTEVCTVVTGE